MSIASDGEFETNSDGQRALFKQESVSPAVCICASRNQCEAGAPDIRTASKRDSYLLTDFGHAVPRFTAGRGDS